MGSIYSIQQVSYWYTNREERMNMPDVRAAHRPPVLRRTPCSGGFDCLTATRSNRSAGLRLVFPIQSLCCGIRLHESIKPLRISEYSVIDNARDMERTGRLDHPRYVLCVDKNETALPQQSRSLTTGSISNARVRNLKMMSVSRKQRDWTTNLEYRVQVQIEM